MFHLQIDYSTSSRCQPSGRERGSVISSAAILETNSSRNCSIAIPSVAETQICPETGLIPVSMLHRDVFEVLLLTDV